MRIHKPRLALVLCFLSLSANAGHAQGNGPILSLNLSGHTAQIDQVLFTPDGKELISIGEDKVVRVWNTATGETLRTIRGQIGDGPVGKLYAAALSPDGQTLAVGGYLLNDTDKTYYIRLLDPKTGHVKRLITGLSKPVVALAFSPNGQSVVSGDGSGAVRVSNVHTGDGDSFKGHTGAVYGGCLLS